jgi:hypothetical protein
MGNRLTGEDRDLITSKVTLAEDGPTLSSSTITMPLSSEFASDILRLLADGHVVIRAWDVQWPAGGGKPFIRNDTGTLPTPYQAAAAARAAKAREKMLGQVA